MRVSVSSVLMDSNVSAEAMMGLENLRGPDEGAGERGEEERVGR